MSYDSNRNKKRILVALIVIALLIMGTLTTIGIVMMAKKCGKKTTEQGALHESLDEDMHDSIAPDAIEQPSQKEKNTKAPPPAEDAKNQPNEPTSKPPANSPLPDLMEDIESQFEIVDIPLTNEQKARIADALTKAIKTQANEPNPEKSKQLRQNLAKKFGERAQETIASSLDDFSSY